LEDVMLDIMYELPSQHNVRECVISEEVIEEHSRPLLTMYEKKAESA